MKHGREIYTVHGLLKFSWSDTCWMLRACIGYEGLIFFGSVKACPHWQQIVAEIGNKLLPVASVDRPLGIRGNLEGALKRERSAGSRGGGSRWCRQDLGSSTESKNLRDSQLFSVFCKGRESSKEHKIGIRHAARADIWEIITHLCPLEQTHNEFHTAQPRCSP